MGMPGFGSGSSQEFSLAAGSVHGYRWWTLNPPDLNRNPFAENTSWNPGRLLGQTRQYRWEPGINEASCLSLPVLRPAVRPEHRPPEENCGCGVYAYWAPPEIPHFHGQDLWVLGVIQGFGRTLIGSEGFRCQKARIAALHLPAFQFEVVLPGTGWHAQWYDVFSQPGLHRPPYGKAPPQEPSMPASADQLNEANDRLRSWQAVIEDWLEQTYPGTRVMAERRALLAQYPPFRDRAGTT